MIVIPDTAKLKFFGSGFLIDGWNITGKSWVRLFKTDMTLDDATTLAALNAQQADFPGYAQQNLVIGPAAEIVNGRARQVFQGVSFTMNDDAPTNTIYGYYVRTTWGGEALLFCEKFAVPQVMDFDGAELAFIPRLDLDQLSS